MQNLLCDEGYIKQLCRRFGFSFSKSLGQNFLIDESVPFDIAAASGADENTGVIEIGPGMGTLTVELCRRAKHVVAVELDKSLLPVLEYTLADFDNVTVVNGDFLKIDTKELIEREFYARGIKNIVVCANLPYYITTPIIMGLLEAHLPISAITVMIQKEVALRLCADAPCGDWGAVTLAVQYSATGEILFEVPPTAFMPAPKVYSAVIRLTPLEKPPIEVENEKFMFRIIKAAFAYRRKTLVNALSMQGCASREQTATALESIGLSPDIRGEKLTLAQFAALADALSK